MRWQGSPPPIPHPTPLACSCLAQSELWSSSCYRTFVGHHFHHGPSKRFWISCQFPQIMHFTAPGVCNVLCAPLCCLCPASSSRKHSFYHCSFPAATGTFSITKVGQWLRYVAFCGPVFFVAHILWDVNVNNTCIWWIQWSQVCNCNSCHIIIHHCTVIQETDKVHSGIEYHSSVVLNI